MFARDNLVGATRLIRVRGTSSVQTCVAFGTQFWLVPRRASRNTSDLIYRLLVCLLLRTIYTGFKQNTQFSEEKNGFQQLSSQKNMADVVSLVTFELSTYLICVGSLQDCLLILGLKSYLIIRKNAFPASQKMSPHYKKLHTSFHIRKNIVVCC